MESTKQIVNAINESKKDRKTWREDFKNNKDFPEFDGSIFKWEEWKRSFSGFLGSNNLESLLKPPITNKNNKNYDKNDAEKNEWLYYMF